jgi:hypothetical protein
VRDRLRRLAWKHWGFVPVEVARRAQIPPATLRTLAHRGHLRQVSHGVYCLPHLRLDEGLNTLRVLYHWPCCDRATVAYEAAAWLWTEDWSAYPFQGVVNLIVPPSYRSNRHPPEDLRLIRAALPAGAATRHLGIRVTTPWETLASWIGVSDPEDGLEMEDIDYRLTAMADKGFVSRGQERELRTMLEDRR